MNRDTQHALRNTVHPFTLSPCHFRVGRYVIVRTRRACPRAEIPRTSAPGYVLPTMRGPARRCTLALVRPHTTPQPNRQTAARRRKDQNGAMPAGSIIITYPSGSEQELALGAG